MEQAKLAKVFKVESLSKHGLYIPTGFQKKAPFEDDPAYNYILLHAGPERALSTALAEELVRPADWPRHSNPAQSDYPNFGYYAVGVECHRTAVAPEALLG